MNLIFQQNNLKEYFYFMEIKQKEFINTLKYIKKILKMYPVNKRLIIKLDEIISYFGEEQIINNNLNID